MKKYLTPGLLWLVVILSEPVVSLSKESAVKISALVS
jgi:hypothetical protein